MARGLTRSHSRDAAVSFHSLTVLHAGMSRPVLDEVELRLERGITAIVGANGAGKSTLLGVVTGAVVPTSGSVRLDPGASVGAVPADGIIASAEVRAFADADDGVARALRGQLALEAPMLDRWTTLSSGERRRWQLGAALAEAPDVLLLDEPEGHLDADSRALVVTALRRFAGIVLMVTHDRALIDEVASSIVRIHEGSARRYDPPYASARDAWEASRARALEAHHRARAEERALAARLDDARRRAEAASRGVSARSRMKGIRDHDGRGALAGGLAARASARVSREAHVLRTAHARAAEEVPFVARDATLGRELFVRARPSPSSVALHLEASLLGPRDAPVLRDVTLTVMREDRIRLHGPNGAGKSTLVRALVAAAPPSARVGYLAQELDPTRLAELAERVAAEPPEDRGRMLSLVAALGADPARIARALADPTSLSPGEAKKLALAALLSADVSVLILDEPTNHLDLASVERLERALELFPGALVLVTHDDAFAAACTRRVVQVGEGTVR